MPSARQLLTPRSGVWLVALGTVLARFPGAIWPLRPDESGFLMVARSWAPAPQSLYGPYWVDRPPPIIGLVSVVDAVAGPLALRVVAAVGCAVVVLLAAAATRHLVQHAAGPGPAATASVQRRAERAGLWAAAFAGALCAQPLSDSVSAKGEVLGIPLVMASCWASLVALERGSSRWASVAGLLAMTAVGLKQSLVGGLAFGGVLLLGALLTRRLDGRGFGRLAVAAVVGAAVPVLLTIGWTVVAGVDLGALWYATVEFRAEATRVLASHPSQAPVERAHDLVRIALVSGSAVGVGWFLLTLPRTVRRVGVPAVAGLVMLAVDVGGLVLGGSYWRPYLVAIIPSVALGLATVLAADAAADRGPGVVVRRLLAAVPKLVVSATVASTLFHLVEWTVDAYDADRPIEFYVGDAIRRSAAPEDTLVVYGGRADVQWASGLPSPYSYLWSLPMRTRDPDLLELQHVLEGPQAPTWFVRWVSLDSWGLPAREALLPVLREKYVLLEPAACGDHAVYRLRTETRPSPPITCRRDGPVLPRDQYGRPGRP